MEISLFDLNVENAFGSNDCDIFGKPPVIQSIPAADPKTTPEEKENDGTDVEGPVLIDSCTAKSTPSSEVLTNMAKEAVSNNDEEIYDNLDHRNVVANETSTIGKGNNDAASSFFETLDESGDFESTSHLFVDSEPVHFSKPPRRSYNNKRKEVSFDLNEEYNDESDDGEKKKKKKKNKKDAMTKAEKRQMKQWIETMNRTYDEIENFVLLVE